MKILPVHREVIEYIRSHNLEKKFIKQVKFLESNIHHPSLEVELLEPKHLRFYSFRIDKQYRATFIFRQVGTIEIIDVNNHYR